jgi:hypothetical protein
MDVLGFLSFFHCPAVTNYPYSPSSMSSPRSRDRPYPCISCFTILLAFALKRERERVTALVSPSILTDRSKSFLNLHFMMEYTVGHVQHYSVHVLNASTVPLSAVHLDLNACLASSSSPNKVHLCRRRVFIDACNERVLFCSLTINHHVYAS